MMRAYSSLVSGRRESVEVAGEVVEITSPDRVIFSDRGWTKLDIVEHFRMCADGALRGVYDRPTMLKRYMATADDDPVYQKRAPKGSAFETVDLTLPGGRETTMVVPRRPVDVVRLAQLGCLDLHPWPSRASAPERPDEMRIDLDPTPGVVFDDVRAAAGAVRDLLVELGLVGWPKTSGSRGIHVLVRIAPRWSFGEVRRAVLAFGRELERRFPGLVTTAWWKEERAGVFLDYNQMAPDKTVSSAYGVRPTGYVSAPFRWDELGSVAIEDFPLDRFARRYAEVGDLHAGIDDSSGALDTLLEWVARDEARGLGDAPWPPHYAKQPGEPPRVQPSKRRADT